MNAPNSPVELARVPIAKMQDVLLARFIGRDEGLKLGFTPTLLTRIATAISEISRNIVQHARCAGEIQILHLQESDRNGLRFIVTDKGLGMAHPEQFVHGGQLGTLGGGLAGTSKLADQFNIKSAPGQGTVVIMDFWKREM